MAQTVQGFDPKAYEMCGHKTFDEQRVGDRFLIPSRTIGGENFAAYQLASGYTRPNHYDIDYCRARGQKNLSARGYRALFKCAQSEGTLTHNLADDLVGLIGQFAKVLRPLVLGDTVYPAQDITELDRQRTTGVFTPRNTVHNQRRELILDG